MTGFYTSAPTMPQERADITTLTSTIPEIAAQRPHEHSFET